MPGHPVLQLDLRHSPGIPVSATPSAECHPAAIVLIFASKERHGARN